MENSIFMNVLVIGLLRGGLFALMAVGLCLMLGVMNMISMVNGEFYMIGAYIAYFALMTFKLGPIISISAAALISFLIGALIERGPFRIMRKRVGEDWVLNTFLLTVGLSILIKNLAQLLFTANYRGITWFWDGSVNIIGVGISYDRLVSFSIAMISILGLQFFLRFTRLGRAIRAVSEDERGAILSGINVSNIYTLAFAIATMLCGLAGASMLSMIPAYPFMGVGPNNYAWLVIMLAGLGNIGGAIVGGFVIGIIESASFQIFGSGWPGVVSAVLLVLVLVVKPYGIFGTAVKGVWEK
jgi:branched-chain amino acid transport system permease protein